MNDDDASIDLDVPEQYEDQDLTQYETGSDQPVVLPPLPRDEAIIPRGTAAAGQRELYAALMEGFAQHEAGALEHLMIDNIERLRETGDSYAP